MTPVPNGDPIWLFDASPASAPAVELRRELVTVGPHHHRRPGREQVLYVIVWDTEHGHVIYLQPLDQTIAHRDWLAVYAGELIQPHCWSTAIVVMPLDQPLPVMPLTTREKPFAYVYRLTGTPAQPAAVWEGQMDLAAVARVLGRPVPVWLDGTTTSTNGEQSLSSDHTFAVSDTITEWPVARDRLAGAVDAAMAGEYPAGFAALAVDAAQTLGAVRAAHERLADTGPGWFLACRPTRPEVTAELEPYLANPAPVTDLSLVENELVELRAVEADLDYDDPRGDSYEEAMRLLAWQVRRAVTDAGAISNLSQDYVPVADDHLVRYSAPWKGAVVEAWRDNFTHIDDVESLLRRRRIRRLIGPHHPSVVLEVYQDPQGRYVLVVELGVDELWSLAEWPIAPHVVSTWTEKTVLAADTGGGAVTLLAFTTSEDDQVRIDPVPLQPGEPREAFGYGYSGGAPSMTYRALLRCALGDRPGLGHVLERARQPDNNGHPASELWHAISTTTGPLRLPWPYIKLWARADAAGAGTSQNGMLVHTKMLDPP